MAEPEDPEPAATPPAMRIVLARAALGAGLHAALPPVDLEFASGAPAVTPAEGGQRPTLLSLLAAGRMRPSSGSVRAEADGRRLDAAGLRRAAALIDTPAAAEYEAELPLSAVVRQELVFAGLPAGPAAVRAQLEAHKASAHARAALGAVPGALRIRLLCELALLRPGVRALVVTSPERHRADPLEWWACLGEIAGRGVAVLAVSDVATTRLLRAAPEPPRPSAILGSPV